MTACASMYSVGVGWGKPRKACSVAGWASVPRFPASPAPVHLPLAPFYVELFFSACRATGCNQMVQCLFA